MTEEEEKEAIERLFHFEHINGYLDLTKKEAIIPSLKIKEWQNDVKLLREAVKKLQADIEIKDKVIDLLIDDVYDNDNFWKLKCGFERIEKGKEKEYIKERFYKKVEEENE